MAHEKSNSVEHLLESRPPESHVHSIYLCTLYIFAKNQIIHRLHRPCVNVTGAVGENCDILQIESLFTVIVYSQALKVLFNMVREKKKRAIIKQTLKCTLHKHYANLPMLLMPLFLLFAIR